MEDNSENNKLLRQLHSIENKILLLFKKGSKPTLKKTRVEVPGLSPKSWPDTKDLALTLDAREKGPETSG